jgi:site-specific recombinase XerC
MIIRGNWNLVKAYLRYRKEVDRLCDKSLRLERTWLIHLLEWVDNQPFTDVEKIRPTFPEYVLHANKQNKPYSKEYLRKVVSCGRRFLEWLTKHKPGYKTKISLGWLDTLKPPKTITPIKEHEHVTLEEIKAIAQAETISIRERRIQAAAVFWYLSGIRIKAFVTLPIKAINLNDFSIKQWPALGVATKNQKHATTYMLNIPELLPIVQRWDQEVRSHYSDNALWFAPLSPETGCFDASIQTIGRYRDTRARKDLQAFLNRVELIYHSPHKFRHGQAVYAIKQAQTVGELKAVSQNMTHSNLSTTDGIYGVLSPDDVKNKIINLGNKLVPGISVNEEVINHLRQIEELLKNH